MQLFLIPLVFIMWNPKAHLTRNTLASGHKLGNSIPTTLPPIESNFHKHGSDESGPVPAEQTSGSSKKTDAAENSSSKSTPQEVSLITETVLNVTDPATLTIRNVTQSNSSKPIVSEKINENVSTQPEIACKFPKLEPWSASAKSWVTKPNPVNCTKRFPRFFNSTVSAILPAKSKEEFQELGIESCCYRLIERGVVGSKISFSVSPFCYTVSLQNSTDIPPTHEFVAVECSGPYFHHSPTKVDVHAFPLPPIISKEQDQVFLLPNLDDKPNILIITLDSISRLSLHRMMPLTRKYLMETLSAIEMKVYNKVGQYTYHNQLPMLANMTPPEMKGQCAPKRFSTVDSCPIIWKTLSKQGYLTGFAEECSSSFYVHMGGFRHRPTDFYLRPLMQAVDKYVSSVKPFAYWLCAGPRLYFELLLDYILKVNQALRDSSFPKRPYFYINWMGALGHDESGMISLADKPLLTFLESMSLGNYFNNTILILVSEHGIEYGKFRETTQGYLETMLPLWFFVLPKWFQEKYPRAYKNLLGNRERLVTSFDFYATLDNLARIDELEDDLILKRENELEEAYKHKVKPRGISLFLPVPRSRTCDDARIQKEYCACGVQALRKPN